MIQNESLRIGLVQLCSRQDVEENLERSEAGVRKAAARGAELIVLPENFAFIGPAARKAELAETLGQGPITSRMAALARELGIYLVLGGLPEPSPEPGKVYNTCAVYGPDGQLRGAYRKIHLFDIHVEEAIGFLESSTVAPGNQPVVLDLPPIKLGLTICYDLRFPELYRHLALQGAELILVPAAFTLYTGKDHWHPLLRARAIENVVYVAAAAQFGRHGPKRFSYGRSLLVDPWGRVLAEAPDGENEVLVATIHRTRLQELRRQMPTLQHVRPEHLGIHAKRDNGPPGKKLGLGQRRAPLGGCPGTPSPVPWQGVAPHPPGSQLTSRCNLRATGSLPTFLYASRFPFFSVLSHLTWMAELFHGGETS